MNKEAFQKGEIYWFDPLKENQPPNSPLAIILSNRLHNQFADHLIIGLVSKNIEKIKTNIEIGCQAGEKELKILLTWIYTVNKKFFGEKAIFLGKANKSAVEDLNSKLKLILKLDE
jgi:mRNA-degrading endonuclease toxin of MazEF toxin-antitoxin module